MQTVQNGNVTFTTDGFVTMATVTCETGATLDGQHQLQCDGVNGTWDNPVPSCG